MGYRASNLYSAETSVQDGFGKVAEVADRIVSAAGNAGDIQPVSVSDGFRRGSLLAT